jgi:hypothetical protein
MDVSSTRAPYNHRQYQGNNIYTNAMITQSQEEPHRPQPKGPYFNCKKQGHFAKDCHSTPMSNINYMDAMEEDMQNIPQPTITPQANVANLPVADDLLRESKPTEYMFQIELDDASTNDGC